MKQSLDLQLGQHLTITPQLQQAIRLLQLSSIELQQEIQEALESNPLLEEKEEESAEQKTEEPLSEFDKDVENSQPDSGALQPTDMEMDQPNVDDGPGSDTDWGDTFEVPSGAAVRSDGDDSLPDIDARNSRPLTLRDHLYWQMQMTPFSDTDREIALAIIDSINEDGYLTCTLEEIQQILGEGQEIELDEIEAVLHQVQNFDPVGVAARDLSECLQLQLRTMDPNTPYLEQTRQLAKSEYLAMLANRDYSGLRRQTKIRQEELQHAVRLLRSLNPRPGASVQAVQTNYIVPDIIVRKYKGVWRAEMNGEVAPRLRINREYEKLINRGDTSAENKYLQDQLQQARWFIKSLNSRNETLLKVARTIVDRQRAFFEHGPEAMKPLVLHDIAESVEMHESTISRVTTNKYMLSPRGIFELKYFFSSHVSTADGGTCSATAIRSLIKKLVENEPPSRPISDSKIAKLLEQQGINVARRTVAKYRESMNIPPSNQRKSII
ncbi:MAG: RNA polymerase factor sigma-54 [Acidiferrobacterales bacterium]